MSFTAERRRWLAAGAMLLVVLSVITLWSARDTMRAPDARVDGSTAQPDSILPAKAIARRALGSTVQIRALDALGDLRSDGTGFFVTRDGLIATSLHVIRGAHTIEVHTLYGTGYDSVSFVAASARHDLAVLKVNVTDAPTLPLAGTGDPEIGERVFVSGNPLGQAGTFTDGLVSARRASEGITYLQISAPIAAGSSGGPVLNDRGQVLGVTTLRLQRGQNLNYAVPSRYLKRLLDTAGKPVRYVRAELPELTRPGLWVSEPGVTQAGHSTDEPELDVITRQLRTSDSLLQNVSGIAHGEAMKGSLAQGDTASRKLTLVAGREYVIAGYCDEHCATLSLAVKSAAGRVVDNDSKVDDKPKLRFIAASSGTYTLAVVMSECDMKACRFGARTYLLKR
ncbi:MAG: S1C family serine protease [Gemmatimonadaceae bacterium]